MFQYLASLVERFYAAFIYEDRYLFFIQGIKNTLIISFFAVIIGTLIGTLVAAIRFCAKDTDNILMKIILKISNIYVTVIRATPVYLQIFIIANLIFTMRDAEIYAAITCFGINSGAYVSEIIRAGIEAVDKGQMEAGASLGLQRATVMKSIILPQAIRNILPALGNEFIALIKETAIAGAIAITDITKAAQYIGSKTWDVLPPLFIAAFFYLIIVLGITKILSLLERRLSSNDNR